MNILFARFYGAAESGRVFYLFTIYAFIIQLVSFSLESGIGYYTAKKSIPDGKLLGFSLVWSLLATTVIAISFIPVARLISGQMNYSLWYPVTYILGNLLISFGNAFCYSRYRFILPNLVSIGVNCLLIALLIAGRYLYGNLDFISLYVYSFLFHGLVLFVALIFLLKDIRISFRLHNKEIRDIFRYSSYAFIANLLFIAITRIDYLFIKHYSSSADLGNYIQVSKIGQMFFILPSIISTVLFPVVASGLNLDVVRHIKKVSVTLLVVYGAICVLPAAAGKWLFPMVYGESFSDMYIPFLLLMPGILAMSALYPYAAFYSGNNRIIVNIKGSVLAFLVILCGDALFIPAYGINAAALVSSVGYAVCYGYIVSVFKKESQLS